MSTVAILGGGQLARMLALAGHPLGIHCRVLDPAPDCPATGVATVIAADWLDARAWDQVAKGAVVATLEREHLPMDAVHGLASRVPMRPQPLALEQLQNRADQRRFLSRLGLTQPDVVLPADEHEYRRGIADLGLPVIVKSTLGGFDARGQQRVATNEQAELAWTSLSAGGLVIERFVPFDEELAVLAVRSTNGQMAFWPLVSTRQVDGMLALARPHPHGQRWQAAAEAIARSVAEALEYVGVLCVELFRVGDRLLVNEVAPRVHNSGHWTIEGAECSQFENHLRAIVGLPLGSTALRGASAIINLIGVLPSPSALLAIPGVHWHDYGKQPRPRRKIGHLTVTADDAEQLDQRLARLRALGLSIPDGVTP